MNGIISALHETNGNIMGPQVIEKSLSDRETPTSSDVVIADLLSDNKNK